MWLLLPTPCCWLRIVLGALAVSSFLSLFAMRVCGQGIQGALVSWVLAVFVSTEIGHECCVVGIALCCSCALLLLRMCARAWVGHHQPFYVIGARPRPAVSNID